MAAPCCSVVEKLTCRQSQPNRNHHCVLVIDDGLAAIDDASRLPCNSQTCHINLVLSAHDHNAGPGERLVVGADSGGKAVNGDKGRVNFSRYRPDGPKGEAPLVSEARLRPVLPIAGEGAKVTERAVYSVELGDLRLGEQLVIDGKLVTAIGNHAYNAFQTTGIVLSANPKSASREGWPERVGDLNGQIAEANGFNCTQGESAHESPCVARKVGVLEITRDSPKTLYVNLVAGHVRPGRLQQSPPQQRRRRGAHAGLPARLSLLGRPQRLTAADSRLIGGFPASGGSTSDMRVNPPFDIDPPEAPGHGLEP